MNDADYVAAFQRILLPVAYEVQQAVLYIHYMVYYLYIYIYIYIYTHFFSTLLLTYLYFSDRRALARNVRPFTPCICRQYTKLFIFRFVFKHCLRRKQLLPAYLATYTLSTYTYLPHRPVILFKGLEDRLMYVYTLLIDKYPLHFLLKVIILFFKLVCPRFGSCVCWI